MISSDDVIKELKPADKEGKKPYFYIRFRVGFGEINNLLYGIYYSKKKGLSFRFLSPNMICPNYRQMFFNGKKSKKWGDYFVSLKNYKDHQRELLSAIRKKLIKVSFPEFNFPKDKSDSFLLNFKRDLKKITKIILTVSINFVFYVAYKSLSKRFYLKIFDKLLGKLLGKLVDKIDSWFVTRFLLYESGGKIAMENDNAARSFCGQERAKDKKAFYRSMHNILLDFWQINPEVYEKVKIKIDAFKKASVSPKYAVINIRRGEKVTSREDIRYEMEKYLDVLVQQDTAREIKTLFLATDDSRVYLEMKKKLLGYRVLTFSNEKRKGHFDIEFLRLPLESKEEKFIEYLVNIEISRHSDLFIGSFNTNFYRLISYFKQDEGCHDVSGVVERNISTGKWEGEI